MNLMRRVEAMHIEDDPLDAQKTTQESGNAQFLPPDLLGPQAGVLITGAQQSRVLREGGIYDLEGLPLKYSDIVSGELTTTPSAVAQFPHDIRRVEAPVLFAGLVTEQFGHILLNSLGRLWALEQLPSETRLLFVPKRSAARKNYPNLRSVLDAFGAENEFILNKGPLAFDELYLASDLFGERYDGLGAPAFFDWLDRKLPSSQPIKPGRKIYVSRSLLGTEYGRFASEQHLEKLLAASGYEIFAPECHDLEEQISVFQGAERLIFAEGSALHLYLMVRRPEQRAAIIKRRESLPALVENQLCARQGNEIQIIHAINELYWPPRRSDHLSVALLDFSVLRSELVATGMIDADASWAEPTRNEQFVSLNAGLETGERMLNRDEREIFLSEIRAGAEWKRARAVAQGETN